MNEQVMTQVMTTDGRTLGIVGAVEGDRFRIDAHDGTSYWLSATGTAMQQGPSAAATSEGIPTTIEVPFTYAELDAHRVAAPSAGASEAGDERHRAEERGPLLPAEDEQRRIMLADVVEQREEREDDGTALPDSDRTVGEPVEDELARLTDDRA